MVILAIITSLFIAIQDPIIQKFAVRFAGGYLSEKTGADIKVGRLVVTPDFRVLVEDVSVKDLKGNDLAKIEKLSTRIDVPDLLDGKLHLEKVELQNTEANLIQYEGEDQLNFAFLADAFKSDKEKPEKDPMPIIIDKISLKDVDFTFWNQNSDHPEKTDQNLMDYSHLVLKDINLEASNLFVLGDSISANIANLSATEISGLDLKHLQANAVVTQKGIHLDGLQMETNNSRFDLDLNMNYNGFDDFSSFVDSVVFDATIRPTDVMLSDIGVFTEVMYKMPDRVQFEGKFTGPIRNFRVDDIKADLGKSTHFEGNISMHPLDFNDGYHTLKIKKMHFTYDDLTNFYIPSSTKTIPLPESLRTLNSGDLSLDFKGSYNNFASDITLRSGIGDIDASIARAKDGKGDNVFSGYVNAQNVKAGEVANISKFVGDLNMDANFTAKFPKKGGPEFMVDGMVTDAQLLGNHINEVKLDGNLKENRFKGKIRVDDDDLFLDFNGLVDFQNKKHPKSDFEAVIEHADLSALNLVKNDSVCEVSTHIVANMTGFDIDDLEGTLNLESTVYKNSRGSYTMDNFTASIFNDNLLQRRINVDCDFLDFEMAGLMNFAHLMPVLNEFGNTFVDFPMWAGDREQFRKYREKHNVEQDFYVKLNLKDTQTLSRLFMPSLKIAKGTSVNGTFTSQSNQLNLTVRSKNIQFGDLAINNVELKNFNFLNTLFGSLSVGEVAWTKISETDTTVYGLENIALHARMTNDTIHGSIQWDDDDLEDHNKAKIDAYFHPHEHGGIGGIKAANVTINDSLWIADPNNYVDISDGRVTLSNLMFSHNLQSIRLDGFAPMQEADTLSVLLNQFDISNFDMFFKGFDVDGFVTGDALISSLKANPMVLADLEVKDIAVDGEAVGDAKVESSWDNTSKSVNLNVDVFNDKKKTLDVTGSYYTAKETDNLDFAVDMDSLRLVALSPLLTGVVSRLQGYGDGYATIKGSIDHPVIEGRLGILDGGCKIEYLQTFYTFNPTILIDSESIRFEDMVLRDTLGNQAIVDGQIHHNNLKDFNLDLKIHPRDFLALATSSEDNDTFYGTAVANGLITVKGPFNDILLDIKALTRRGTHLTIPLNKSNVVKDNDFIVFVQKEEEHEEEEVIPTKKEEPRNFTLALDVAATDDATLKIILPSNIGTIEASGNGSMKMGTSSKTPFTMRGDYTIKSGKFQLTLVNVISRLFNLKQGGTITWSGDPTDGRINATGVYSVKTSLSGLGVQVDTTATNSNINVECLIHLKGALLNPNITFGMNLPNASEDITQTVYSLIDTTNQAVMTQQALSLLVLGNFAYAGMGGSDLNLSNIFGGAFQVDITDNLNLGLRYHSGNYDSYDEYQLAMRTQLFQNRLTIETNLGMMTANNPNASNASSLVGEFDMYYKLTQDGRLQAHFYNHSNYNSNFNSLAFDRRSPYTQGLGLSYSRSFDSFRNMFKKKTVLNSQPMIRPKKEENN